MEDAGQLSEVAAMHHSRRNEVYRDLGSAPHAPDDPDFVEIHTFVPPESSALLLCSDGLTDQVPVQEIRRIIEQHAGEPEAGALALTAAANEAGGKDNVSAILIQTIRYAAVPERTTGIAANPSRWRWFLVGLLAATALCGALRPYIEETTSGARLRFGTVRPPQTWMVSQSGSRTIAETLERARVGDTISVGPGEYHEALHLRNGVSLVSSEMHGAKIMASGVVVMSDGVQNAHFSGFEILGPGDVGIRIQNSELDVTGVKVSGMRLAGVEIEGGQPLLQASTIEDNGGVGVYVHGVTSPRIDHNLIRNNGVAPELLPGLFIAGSATPRVFGNVIANNGAEQVWISPFYKEGTLLKENVIAPTSTGGELSVKVVTR
jgi:hypothetical protein